MNELIKWETIKADMLETLHGLYISEEGEPFPLTITSRAMRQNVKVIWLGDSSVHKFVDV